MALAVIAHFIAGQEEASGEEEQPHTVQNGQEQDWQQHVPPKSAQSHSAPRSRSGARLVSRDGATQTTVSTRKQDAHTTQRPAQIVAGRPRASIGVLSWPRLVLGAKPRPKPETKLPTYSTPAREHVPNNHLHMPVATRFFGGGRVTKCQKTPSRTKARVRRLETGASACTSSAIFKS